MTIWTVKAIAITGSALAKIVRRLKSPPRTLPVPYSHRRPIDILSLFSPIMHPTTNRTPSFFDFLRNARQFTVYQTTPRATCGEVSSCHFKYN
ncbi:expressed unknown protein [Seminavis robusta]|uniref:Uncharacterized protein n=1 Tax=Seminavis robusta TaxID=568900 RepID=A0A9N8ETV9_9STRA|nr:expressed unknown protein [Seminavis robusta]|eukprot:Sro1861_g302200.1 n/a (93) ;mRNA; r:14373-15269